MDSAAVAALLDALLARRAPIDEQERRSVERFRHDLAGLADPCSESADTTHVTSSAIVVGPRGVVLHRHKRLGIWLQPGGHIDLGEHAADAAVRETREETGLDVVHFTGTPQLVHVDAHDGPRGHFHLDLRYLLTVDPVADPDPAPPEGESPDARWFSWGELLGSQDAPPAAPPGMSGLISALTHLRLRPAAQGDAAAIAECYLRSFRWAYARTDVRLVHPDDDVRRWVRESMLPDSTVTVADAAGVVVGFSAQAPGHLAHLYADPAWIGRGVGAALLRAAQRADPSGFDLWTFECNTRARAFYSRHGFEAVEHGDGSGNEEGQPDVRMAWTPN